MGTETPADVRARHAEMVRLSGGTGRPEDYLERLSFILPFGAEQQSLLVFCGCCLGPLQVIPELGLWVSWQKDDAIAPLCAVCLEYLRQREHPAHGPVTIHVLPEYDALGQGYRDGLDSMSPAALAQARMAHIESILPQVAKGAGAHDVAAIAREAFLETADTLRGLAELWRAQRPDRLKVGRHLMALKSKATPGSLRTFDDILGDLPGAMQAYREAEAAGDGV